MEDLDDWRLCGELTVIQAALLTVGISPTGTQELVENLKPDERPPGYEAIRTAIKNALRDGAIEGTRVPRYEIDINGYPYEEIEGSVDVTASEVEVESLKAWFLRRDYRPVFFFPLEEDEPVKEDEPDYLDSGNTRYAPKLAAAVRAWQAVADPGPKHPRQALEDWLVKNAADLGLTDEKGKLNRTGIEQIAAVANWRWRGGAPKTPGS